MVQAAAKHYLDITIQAISRGNNEAADKLAKMASSEERPSPKVFYEVRRAPSAALEAQGVALESQGAVHLMLLINEAD